MIRYPIPNITNPLIVPKQTLKKNKTIKKNKYLDQILSEKFKNKYLSLRKY
tara:strand:- start:28851 stop:29003 length:153 start_codon:yes stop_codon:yes gene_type:complete